MNDDFKYLSDEELNNLIESTEKSGLLEAPISFEAEVLRRLEGAENKNELEGEQHNQSSQNILSMEDKRKAYSKFRFQVCMAMAAAILFLIVAPFITLSESMETMSYQTEEGQVTESISTNYVSDFLGNHILSESMTSRHFGIGKED